MRFLLLAWILVTGCGDDDGTGSDVGPGDVGPRDTSMDGAPVDAPDDTGTPPVDTSPADTSLPDGSSGDVVWFEDVATTAGIDVVRTPADDYQSVPDRMSGPPRPPRSPLRR